MQKTDEETLDSFVSQISLNEEIITTHNSKHNNNSGYLSSSVNDRSVSSEQPIKTFATHIQQSQLKHTLHNNDYAAALETGKLNDSYHNHLVNMKCSSPESPTARHRLSQKSQKQLKSRFNHYVESLQKAQQLAQAFQQVQDCTLQPTPQNLGEMTSVSELKIAELQNNYCQRSDLTKARAKEQSIVAKNQSIYQGSNQENIPAQKTPFAHLKPVSKVESSR